MSLELNLFKTKVLEVLSKISSVRLATPDDEENIHRILESISMKLQDGLELIYSRRPDIMASYNEALMNPLIFVDQKAQTSTATISHTKYFINGEETDSFYSSDLRFSLNTSLAVKKDFAAIYPQFVSIIPKNSIFTTAVLKENIRAMKLFSKMSQNLHYNPYFEIVTRTLVLLPCIGKRSNQNSSFTIKSADEYKVELDIYLQEKIAESFFSHDIISARMRLGAHREFVILNQNKIIVGYFSLFKTKSRKILIKAESFLTKLLLASIRLLSNNDLRKKIPWTYINNLIIDEEMIENSNILSMIIDFIRKEKLVKNGELLSFTHLAAQPYEGKGEKRFLGFPQIHTETIFYKVELEARDLLIKNKVIIDPTLL